MRMRTNAPLSAELTEQIDHILGNLRDLTKAQCVILADASGQLISVQGQTQEIDPVLIAVLAAADVMATTELIRQIGGRDPGGALFRRGKRVNLYLFDVASSFVLIIIFQTNTLAGLVHTFGKRAVNRLRPLAAEFERRIEKSATITGATFGASLAEEMDRAFER